MKRSLLASVCLLLYIFFANEGFAQCSLEPYTIVNQCPGQQPQVKINATPTANTDFFWFDLTPTVNDTLKLGNGYEMTYPGPLGASETFYFQKQVKNSGGPTAPTNVGSMGGVNDNTIPFSLPYTTTTDFRLNSLTIAVKMYSACSATDEFSFKVAAGGSYSQWYYAKCSELKPTSDNTIFLVTIPVMKTPSEQGITAGAGSGTIRVITTDGTEKLGSKQVSGFEWFSNAAPISSTYTIGGTTTVNYGTSAKTISGQTNKVPGIFDLNITTLCPAEAITITPNSTGCCVPANVTQPAVKSSTGSNIVTSIPPNITLSTPLQTGFYYKWYKDGLPLGASFEGTGKNSITVSAFGKYTVEVAEGSTHISKTSCIKNDQMWIQKRILFAEADKTSPVCLGETVNLLAKGATGPVTWGPPVTNLSSTTSPTPTWSPTATGTYKIPVVGEVPVGNQIINGDFELGNVQINPSAYYIFKDPSGATSTTPNYAIGYPARKALTIGVGNYTINNYVFWPGFQAWLPIEDHTTGTGKFLYVDSKEGPIPGQNKYLWSQDVIVEPNTNYEFAAWVTNFNAEGDAGYVIPPGVTGINNNATNVASNPLPQIMLYINDVPAFASTPVLSATVGLWQKISTVWNSGSNSGNVKLKLSEIFQGSATGGHDFALDDISFGAPGTQKDTITITIKDCFDISATVSACTGDSVTLNATTNGIFQYWRNTTLGTPGTTNAIKSPTNIITKAKSETSKSTQFTASAKFIFSNQIVNGDFSQGNTGFSTTYTAANATSAMNPGNYAVGPVPTTSPVFYKSVNDHTTGTATPNYFMGDSRYDATRIVAYRASVYVTNGKEFGFSGWFTNALNEFTKASPDTSASAIYPNGAKTTKLALYINNQFVQYIKLPLDNNWHNITATWTANTTGPVDLELRSVNQPANNLPNAFAMDDLSFGAVYSVTKTVDVNSVNCVLPVQLLSFNISENNGVALLSWQTATERDASHFIIQKSYDGINYEDLGSVKAGGNSNSVLSYSFTDLISSQGLVYYRLKQVDYNGDFYFSPVRSINHHSDHSLKIYPNPTENSFNIQFNNPSDNRGLLNVYSISGSLIEGGISISGNGKLTFGESLPSGVYILELTIGDTIERYKLIKNR
ncbi:T9SS type A sorting domain-containing protein [Sporocytophaga myxococcoides]|uniref:T9SS type A sorting domain-containing protein n=1 Tax=Sporocytophaga myxococcoides TaxID=153721 RepID=UPI00048CA653|nr:T9SS type A sorting domain-containing protein [Sporocytophaga myxococcoides]